MLRSPPPTARPHAQFAAGPPVSHHPPPNQGVYNGSEERNGQPFLHTVPSEHIQYKGPLHAIPYRTHNVLTPAFQNVVTNWLKSGKRGI